MDDDQREILLMFIGAFLASLVIWFVAWRFFA